MWSSEMTQPAKVQEPSMEEILASIRRIIADDEAKPPVAEKAAAPAALAKPEKPAAAAPAGKPAAMNDIPPSAIAGGASRRRQGLPPSHRRRLLPGPHRRRRPTARTTSTRCWRVSTRRPRRTRSGRPSRNGEVFELTDEMAVPRSAAARVPEDRPAGRSRIHRNRGCATRCTRQPAFEPPPFESAAPPPQQILSRSTVSAVESAFNSLANTVLSNNARTLEDLVKEMLRPMLKSWLDDNLPGLVERIVKAEIERVSRGR